MKKTIKKAERREKIHLRVRKTVKGTAARPRLAVFKSNKYIYVQMIDDEAMKTLAAASSSDETLKSKVKSGGTIEAAKLVGKTIAEKAKQKGLVSVVFDRGGYEYHGRIKALAEAAREGGLKF